MGKTKRISATSTADTRNDLTGYTIVEAESHEAAAKLFQGHPHFTMFPGNGVEIMECLPVPGMRFRDAQNMASHSGPYLSVGDNWSPTRIQPVTTCNRFTVSLLPTAFQARGRADRKRYNQRMANLAATNKHLASAAKLKETVYVTVSTSSAIEGIRAPFKRKASNATQAAKAAKAAKMSPVKSSSRARSA